MRRPAILLLTATLALSSALAACGGGDDDETPTHPPASPTATFAVNPPSRTPTTSSGTGTGPGGGAGGTPVSPAETPTAGQQAAATPTRRPATVVSTPRPIATRPPTVAPQETATEVPPTQAQATPEDGQLTIVMEDSFDDPNNTWFTTGTTEFNTNLTIANGLYTMAPDVNSWQTVTVGPDDSWDFADGLITADVTLSGNVEFGLVARQFQDADGNFSLYLCWLTPDAAAGCSIYQNDEFSQLFRQDGVAQVQDVNHLVMQVIGTEIIFEVNDTQIGTIDDATIASGYWGVYVWGGDPPGNAAVDYAAIAVP